MALIQGIDGGTLLNALRAGRQDRMVYDEQQAQQDVRRQAAERQGRMDDLMGQLFGAQPQGLEAQFTPPQQESPVGAPAAAPTSPPGREPPQRRVNREVLTQLIALDPETGGRIVTALKNLDDANLQAYETKNAMMGAAAQYLSKYPAEQRASLLRNLMPQLAEAGWTPEELNGANLGDEGLQGYIALSMDTDTLIDNERAEREFQQGKIITPQPGEGAFRLTPEGTVETLIAPNPGGMPMGEAVADIPPEAVEALQRGEGSPEQFDEIFGAGAAARIMGGAGGNASGGFPGGAR